MGAARDLLWHIHVLLKVSIFAWRLLHDRMPTKTNLVTRGPSCNLFVLFVFGLCGMKETLEYSEIRQICASAFGRS
jgi:hypothetical protein